MSALRDENEKQKSLQINDKKGFSFERNVSNEKLHAGRIAKGEEVNEIDYN